MLSDEQKKLGRRNFLKAVATVPPTGALLWKTSSMWPVKAGIIGIGGQGGVLMENAPPSHMRISAVCDIFPPNREKALKIAQERFDPDAVAYADHRELLKRSDIEAVLIAAPLWMHEPLAIDALNAGKHVFTEKAMANSIDGCRRMIKAANSAGKHLQVGHQRNYNPLYQEAYQLVREGVIGDVYHVRSLWHRNKSWRRAVPETDFDPSPWGYPDMEHLRNWRLYRKYSYGLNAELGTHHLQVVNWFTGKLPKSVYGSGGIYAYDDGREVEDHIYVTYEYPGGLTYTFSSIQTNAFDHFYEQFMGTEGTIILTREREAMLFSEGGTAAATELKTQAMGDAPLLEASESRVRDAAGSQVTGGGKSAASALRGYSKELEGFCRTIRYGSENLCDGPSAMNVCVPMIKAGESLESRQKVDIPQNLYWT